MGGSLTINAPGANSGLEVPRTCSGGNNSVGDNNVAANSTTSRREDRYSSATPHCTTFIFC